MRNSQYFKSGFGLIELIVSISIMILITTVIMARHDSFNGASLLRGQAYAIALQAREVQLNAISATEGGGFRNVFGLHFDTRNNPNGYTVFRDTNGPVANNNDYFDAGEVYGRQGAVDRRFFVRAIRIMNGATVLSTPTEVSVSFERPNFDARIFTGANAEATTASGVEIDIGVVGTADVRTVEITKTGQISVKGL